MITGSPPRLKLLAVTKGRTPKEIEGLLRLYPAIHRIGENRLEEAKVKFEVLRTNFGADFDRIEKHFIGKLQSRKIREVASLFDAVQSLENLEQAQKLSTAAGELGKTFTVYLEVNLSGLSKRNGAKPEEVSTLLKAIGALPNLRLQGVMGMATPNLEEARAQFKLLKFLQGSLSECSMGMSNDYGIAIEEGSTMLRLGRALFDVALRDSSGLALKCLEEGLPSGVLFE